MSIEPVRYWISDLLAAVWLPLIFIVAGSWALVRFHRKDGKRHTEEVIGIALGVILGFVSQVTVNSFDEFRKDQQTKKAAWRILEHDAEAIYRDTSHPSKDHDVPPHIDMPYWETLQKEPDFLVLARDDRFAEVFQDFWRLEEVNQAIDRANKGDKEAARVAETLYQDTVAHHARRELLQHFLSSEEIAALDRRHQDQLTSL